MDGKCLSCDEVEFDEFIKQPTVIFVISTSGQGKFPLNAKQFWNKLSQLSDDEFSQNRTQFAVFGLGDSQFWKPPLGTPPPPFFFFFCSFSPLFFLFFLKSYLAKVYIYFFCKPEGIRQTPGRSALKATHLSLLLFRSLFSIFLFLSSCLSPSPFFLSSE